jgi:hypothetical protein
MCSEIGARECRCSWCAGVRSIYSFRLLKTVRVVTCCFGVTWSNSRDSLRVVTDGAASGGFKACEVACEVHELGHPAN